MRSATVTIPDLDPSDLAQQTHGLAKYLQQIKVHEANKVEGGAATAPTTGSTQATGAGNTDWNVNLAAMRIVVEETVGDFAAAADFDLHSGSQVPGLDSLDTVVASVVAEVEAGAINLLVVLGVAATTASGNAVEPSVALIEAALSTTGNAWIRVSSHTINRTADTTVTQSEDSARRPMLGITTDTDFAGFTG